MTQLRRDYLAYVERLAIGVNLVMLMEGRWVDRAHRSARRFHGGREGDKAIQPVLLGPVLVVGAVEGVIGGPAPHALHLIL